MPEPEYEAERELVGDLEALDEPSLEAVLPAASGRSSEDAMRVLEAMRADTPDDPFWKGVAEIGVVNGGARVRFNPGPEPRELAVDGTAVQCHLHDADALEAAQRAARGHDRDRPEDVAPD